MESKSNISIWKIRDQFIQKHENKPTQAIEAIRKEYNQSASIRQDLAVAADSSLRVFPTRPNLELPGDNKIKILYKRRSGNGWEKFISPVINPDSSYESFGLENSNSDLVIFIYKGQSVFAVTTGAGYFVIQSYIDDDYPFEIAKRMLSGGFKQADTRSLTGTTYAESRNFRRNYTFNSQDAFGKVWKKLYGEVDKEFLQTTTYLKKFIDVEKTINAEIKSSFTLRKSITFPQLVQTVEELRTILATPLSEEKKQLFRFLESAELIKDKSVIEKLDQKLLKSLYEVIVEGKDNFNDFDFCHPSEPLKFLSAQAFHCTIGRLKLQFEDTSPSYTEVIGEIKESKAFEGLNFADFTKKFNRCIFAATFEEDDDVYQKPLADKLIKYFHGELEYQATCYFRIDAKWYKAQPPFLESLYDIFVEQIIEGDIINNDISFEDYPDRLSGVSRDNREGRFNEHQSRKDAFYFGDMIYAQYGSGEVELFDLLHVDGENGLLYIIQVKEGFAGSMRDACSQIAMAAQAIEDDLRSSKEMLKAYYTKWKLKEQNANLSEEQFLGLFDAKRIYVIACAHKHEFTPEKLGNKRLFKSHIAKFEAVGIAQEFRAQSRLFQLMRIKKSD